jgi:hypothetical protein
MRRVRKRERAREGEGGREGERERDKCEEAFVCGGGGDEMAGVWEGRGRTRWWGSDRLKMVGLSHNVQ